MSMNIQYLVVFFLPYFLLLVFNIACFSLKELQVIWFFFSVIHIVSFNFIIVVTFASMFTCLYRKKHVFRGVRVLPALISQH